MKLKAHAKINLTLEVLGRRADGFHQIRTVLQELELCDIVRLEEVPGREIELVCSDPTLPANEGNLAYGAARLLQERYAPSKGVRMRLTKQIPVAAGLGGGSSNAAAVLRGLNKFWDLALEKETLAKLGSILGSDVPFFLYGGTCLAEGRGEVVHTLPPFPQALVLLAAPKGLELSAGQVYGGLNLDKISVKGATAGLLALLKGNLRDQANIWEEMNKVLVNHLESLVFSKYKEVAILKEKLLQRKLPALLSGSGPTVFALSREEEALSRIGNDLAAQGYRVILTKTV